VKIAESPYEAYAHINHWRAEGLRIGLVPTMGALHAGHMALVHRSRQECDVTAVSIFVNPTQFGPNEDLARYPRTLEADLGGLRALQTDLVFLPSPQQLYPEGFSTYIEPPRVALPLEGVCRPGHFRGVATIVLKLFQICPATIGYFGQKDYQQLTVIRHMVEDLNLPIRIEGCETIRESDGLAMSSRNRYLNSEQRQTATSLWRALCAAKQMVDKGTRDVDKLELAMSEVLRQAGVERIDYARIVDRDSLDTIQQVQGPAVGLIAAHVGTTRLIDNLFIDLGS
jgi:pantoate--beta-alanine ligase